MARQFRSRALSRKSKLCVYKTIVRPVLLYGLRLGLPPGLVNRNSQSLKEEWKRRKNQELYTKFKESDVVRVMKIVRLKWAGYAVRMGSENPPRKLLMEPLHGTRRRPKLQWADGVTADATNILGLRKWMTAVRGRDNWRKLLQEARIRHGIVEPL
ncbi:uncharacterized protein [Halyomorpha halys]|uniref:uncharacterized protein n=1 Tax=Halyomorpha halys TaxID=286706 RepID=UPI0034D1D0F8